MLLEKFVIWNYIRIYYRCHSLCLPTHRPFSKEPSPLASTTLPTPHPSYSWLDKEWGTDSRVAYLLPERRDHSILEWNVKQLNQWALRSQAEKSWWKSKRKIKEKQMRDHVASPEWKKWSHSWQFSRSRDISTLFSAPAFLKTSLKPYNKLPFISL